MQNLPEIPTRDVALGLASASLLIIALFYLARSRPRHFLAINEGRPRNVQPELFERLFQEDAGRELSFIASLFLHMFAVALLPWLQLLHLPVLLPDFGPREFVRLEYSIPDVSLVAPDDLDDLLEPEEEEEPEEETAKAGGGAPATASSEPQQPAVAGGAATTEPVEAAEVKPPPAKKEREVFKPAFKVLLPEIAPADPSLKDIILQPDVEIEFPADYAPQMPPVLAWTPNPRQLENTVLVEPGHREPDQPERWELPQTEPQLVRPNELTTLADLQISPGEVVVEEPALPIPPAVVSPLQGVVPPEEPLPQLPALSEGDVSTTLVALNQQPNPLTPSFVLEMGLQLGRIDSGMETTSNEISIEGEVTEESAASNAESAEFAESQDSAEGVSEPPESEEAAAGEVVETVAEVVPAEASAASRPLSTSEASRATEDTEQQRAAAEGVSSGPGLGTEVADGVIEVAEASSVKGIGTGKPGVPEGKGESVPRGTADSENRSGFGEASSSGRGLDPEGEENKGRLRPLPRKQYGIILVSNSQSALLGGVNGILRGNPVYTVRLDVPEAPRKWTLQFCIPESESKRLDVSDGVIRIRPRKKVAPPFPQKKKPLRLDTTNEPGADRPSQVFVYATVDEEGELRNLRVVKGADPKTDHTILANLQSWEFLPAFRGEEPILVEALFGIPLP